MKFQSYVVLRVFLLSFILFGCAQKQGDSNNSETTLIFKHGKIADSRQQIRVLLDEFEFANPGIRVINQELPASTDEQHQFYVINLEGKTSDFDVFAMDVIWISEFARAGWIEPLNRIFSEQDHADFFSSTLEAVSFKDEIFALPWYLSVGFLYYRKDLLEKYKQKPPKTWDELVSTARVVMNGEPGMHGFVWQGKQYEGLVCNVLEYMWSNGGVVLNEGQNAISSSENREALQFIHDMIYDYRITPEFITTLTEEPSRRIFGDGQAVYLRNWPYAWKLFQAQNSKVRGKVGISILPSFDGHSPAATLGGWHLGVNKFSKHRKLAEKLVLFLGSKESQKKLALTSAYQPARKSVYLDLDFQESKPFTADLYDVFEKARPRPVSPYYMMISQIIQPEFSAVLARIKDPETALQSAKQQIDFVLDIE